MEKLYSQVWNFSEKIKEALKQVTEILCRTDIFYHCNRILVDLNSKSDELKEFH